MTKMKWSMACRTVPKHLSSHHTACLSNLWFFCKHIRSRPRCLEYFIAKCKTFEINSGPWKSLWKISSCLNNFINLISFSFKTWCLWCLLAHQCRLAVDRGHQYAGVFITTTLPNFRFRTGRKDSLKNCFKPYGTWQTINVFLADNITSRTNWSYKGHLKGCFHISDIQCKQCIQRYHENDSKNLISVFALS